MFLRRRARSDDERENEHVNQRGNQSVNERQNERVNQRGNQSVASRVNQMHRAEHRVVDVDLHDFLNAIPVQRLTRFCAQGLKHDRQRRLEIRSALLDRVPRRDRAGHFFHPPEERSVRRRFDDAVILLSHDVRIVPAWRAWRQDKNENVE